MMKTHRKGILFLAVIFALAMAMTGCGGGGGGDGGPNIPPTITLLFPDGGEVLKGGANVNITWTASDDATLPASCIKLEYAVGGSYTVIASGLANSGLYSWTVPTIDSLVVQVRASVTDSNNNTVQDSSGTFTIDSTPPTVNVTAPASDSFVNANDTVTITWTASDSVALAADPITIEYSDNDGADAWTMIIANTLNDGNHGWVVPGGLDNAHIQVSAVDSAGNTSFDEANGRITIDSIPPTVNVTAPPSDLIVNPGDTVTITWSASDNVALAAYPITIEYSDNDGNGAWTMIIANTLNDGTHGWVVPGGLDNAHIQVSAVDSAGNTSFDEANGRITSNTDSTAPTVTGISYGVEGSTADLIMLSGVSGVRRAEYFTIKFSESMDRTTTQAAVTLVAGGPSLGIDFYWITETATDDTLVIVPQALLNDNTGYTLTVGADAQDLSTNTLGTDEVANFNTIVDSTPPVLTSAQTNVGDDLSIMLVQNEVNAITYVFDENIGSVGDFEMRYVFNDVFENYNVLGIGTNTVTIQFDIDNDGVFSETNGDDYLPHGRGFRTNIGVSDTSWNGGKYEHNFVTKADAAGEAPYVVSSIPADGDTSVPCNQPIALVFSESMDPSTITAGIEVKQGAVPLPISYFELIGNLVVLHVTGVPGNSTITIGTNTNLEDAFEQSAAAQTVATFDTGPADATGPLNYSCTIKSNDSDIDERPLVIINLNEQVNQDTVNNSTVFIKDALTGVPFRCFEIDVDHEGNMIGIRHNDSLGTELAFDRNYLLVLQGVEDICGNQSDIEIPFTTASNGGNSAPGIYEIEVEMQKVPEWMFGGSGNTLVIGMEINADNVQNNDAGDTLTASASDGTNNWSLSPVGIDFEYVSDYLADGSEPIAAGPGEMTISVDDGQGHTVTFRMDFFMPATLPKQTSPINFEEIFVPDDVELQWTTPGYNNSVVAISLSADPDDVMSSEYPALFANGKETSLTIPADFNLQPHWHFWSLLHLAFGYDIETMGLNFEAESLHDLFNYVDTTDPSLHTISGTITQAGGLATGEIIIMVPESGDPDGEPVSMSVISAPGSYTVYNLPNNTYDVMAWRDANGNLESDSGEGEGEYLGVTISGANQSNIDFSLAIP